MTLVNLDRFTNAGFEAVVVQPSRYHYYSGMGPGMLGRTYEPEQIRFDTRTIVERHGGKFIESSAVKIDPAHQIVTLADGSEISYDVLSCNTGSHVSTNQRGRNGSVIPAKPISGLIQARDSISNLLTDNSVHIGIIGGGPSAVELACNVRQLADHDNADHVRISLFAGNRIFPGKSGKVRQTVSRYLVKRRIKVVEDYVGTVDNGEIITDRKDQFTCDLVLSATGVAPSSLFDKSGLSTDDAQGLAVNESLQSIYYENIFGGGDCIDFKPGPLDKVGVYAVRQNPVLLHNLTACLKNEPLRRFSPGGGYLLIYNMGGGQGILAKGPLVFSGSVAFRIKDYIDRRFMRTYRS